MFRTISFLILSLGLWQCRSTSESTDLKHDVGRYLNSSSRFQWRELSRDDFLETNAYRFKYLGKIPAPIDDPRQAKVQELVDQLQTVVIKKHPELNSIPRLKALVLLSSEADPESGMNASSWDETTCYSLKIEAPFAPEKFGTSKSVTARYNPISEHIEDTFNQCPKAEPLTAEKAALLVDHLRSYLPGCLLKWDGKKLAIDANANHTCPVDVRRSDSLEIPQSINWITVDAGLLKSFQEDEVLGVLAHEMSHYYLAHAAQPSSLYDYFFAGDLERQGKPIHDKSWDDRGIAIRDALAQIRPFRNVKDSLYNPLTLSVAADSYLALNFMSGGGACDQRWDKDVACTKSCKDLFDLGSDGSFFPLVDSLKKLDEESDPALYLSYEKAASKCYKAITFKTPKAATDFIEALNRQQSVLSLPLPENTPVKNLHEYFQSLTPNIASILEKHNATPTRFLKNEAITQQFGYYTREVEADELGLETYLLLGKDPSTMIEAFVKLSEEEAHEEIPLAFEEIGGKQCRLMMQEKWPVRLPVARFTNSHLSSCYRAFNISQELKRHEAAYRALRLESLTSKQ